MTEKRHLSHHGNLYDLTPSEFEHLVADVFTKSGYSDLKIVDGSADQGLDIIGVTDGKPVAIQVKHKIRLTLRDIKRFVDFYFSNPSNPRTLVFVTSAVLPQSVSSLSEGIPPGSKLHILGHDDIQNMLARHSDISDRYLGRAIRRLKSQRYRFFLSVVGSIASLLGLFISITTFFFPHKAPLDKRIETVEKALASIQDLESYLGEIKQDMIDKEKATEIINQRYAYAKELEKLTDIQLDALKATLQTQNWIRTLFNYVMGFVLGVASSFLASVLHAKWTQRKALG